MKTINLTTDQLRTIIQCLNEDVSLARASVLRETNFSSEEQRDAFVEGLLTIVEKFRAYLKKVENEP